MQLLRQFWRIAKPYWFNRENWFSWVLLTMSISASLYMVNITVTLNEWSKTFYDALAALEFHLIYPLLLEFAWLVALIVVLIVYADWLAELVEIRWRQWLTEDLVQRWFSNGAYYRMTLGNEPDNPDQRIAEDARLLASDSVELFVRGIKSISVLVAFSSILWNLSGNLAIPWNGEVHYIPGYLFWLALIYSIFGTGMTQYFGHQLHGLHYQQQQKEAYFRASLLRKRDNAEQIALFGGEANEKAQLQRSFSGIITNWRALMNRRKNLGLVVKTYHEAAKQLPLFAGIPALIAQTITIGGLFQVRGAFMKVYASFSWFIFSYVVLTRWSATIVRLDQFISAIENQEPLPKPAQGKHFQCQEISLTTPNGTQLLSGINVDLARGSQLLLSGPSGLGKSTLLRTLAGIWPFYRGEVQHHQGQTMLLPQKPYLPAGLLRDCLSYPAEQNYSDEALVNALQLVELPQLTEQLNVDAEWQQRLSGGEQQRLSLARALLAKPDTLILDEATSSLDEAGALALLKTLKQQLPKTSLLMVSHQQSLTPLFERHIDLSQFAANK